MVLPLPLRHTAWRGAVLCPVLQSLVLEPGCEHWKASGAGVEFDHVHWHIMARFEEDSYFPEPMWGTKQRECTYTLKGFDSFIESLKLKLFK